MSGIADTNTLDLITTNDNEVRLVLVEERPLLDSDAMALQEKLNVYLSFAQDGEMEETYPETLGKKVLLRIDLYATPAPSVLDFIGCYREAVARYDVGLELTINGQLIDPSRNA